MIWAQSETLVVDEKPAKKQRVSSKKKNPTKRKNVSREKGKEVVGNKKHHNKELGDRGEAAARKFLENKGFYIHDCNWRCKAGEADIVAEEDDVLVFIEVKTRSSRDMGLPEEAVDAAKRERYEKIAGYYLKDHDFFDKSVRFDVISILVIGGDRAFLRHHRDAFAFCE